MYAQKFPPQYGLQAAAEPMGAWYNNWGDLWGDIRTGAEWLSRGGQAAVYAGQQGQNAANNAQNLTSWRVNVSTVALVAVGVGAVIYVTRKRR